jgi:hypothetical protein
MFCLKTNGRRAHFAGRERFSHEGLLLADALVAVKNGRVLD